MSMRMERVNSEIRKKLMEIIQEELDDPQMDLVSILRVRTSPDLRECRVHFSVLNDEYDATGKKLESMKGFIRASLGKRIRLKNIPELFFIADDSIRYSIDISRKVEEVIKDEEGNKHHQQ